MTNPLMDQFTVAADPLDGVWLDCPVASCNWEGRVPQNATLVEVRRIADEHFAEAHTVESTCEVCGGPVSSWEMESWRDNGAGVLEAGRGLMVKPCGHQVSKVETVIR